nr:PREDICTED: olfactory receptor 8U9-like [Rhinolophus sinicus]
MAQINCTQVTEFILLGLTDRQELKMPLFVIFVSIYLFTVVGNLGLILVIRTDARLNTPMYFFLSNLAFVDFCYASVITPKMLGNFLFTENVISFNACAAQLGCFLAFMTAEYSKQLWIFACAGIMFISSVLIVFVSYMFIISAILRMRSAEGRRKAFSTCGSHMLAVTIFYGTLIFMYLQPSSNHSLDTDKMASVFYTVFIPMLNPLIYSLRNKEVKEALKKVIINRNEALVFMKLKK